MSLSKVAERDLRTSLKRQYENQALTDYICKCLQADNNILLIAALCPDYSTSERTGMYSYDSMGSGVPAAYHKAQTAIEKLSRIIDPYCLSVRTTVKQILLVCDIEGDLPNVVAKFANNDISEFVGKCQGSRDAITKLHHQDPNVEVATFSDHLPNFRSRFHDVLKERAAEESFRTANEQIAQARTHMWTKLYGLHSDHEFRDIAMRQAVNYSLFAQALNEKHGTGKYVLVNDKSPNLRFIRGKNVPAPYRTNIVLEM